MSRHSKGHDAIGRRKIEIQEEEHNDSIDQETKGETHPHVPGNLASLNPSSSVEEGIPEGRQIGYHSEICSSNLSIIFLFFPDATSTGIH